MGDQEPQSKASLLDDADYLLGKTEEVKEAAETALDANLTALQSFRSDEYEPRNISGADVPGLEESQRLEPIPEKVSKIQQTVNDAIGTLNSPLGGHPSIREAVSGILSDATHMLGEAASTVNDTTSHNIKV